MALAVYLMLVVILRAATSCKSDSGRSTNGKSVVTVTAMYAKLRL